MSERSQIKSCGPRTNKKLISLPGDAQALGQPDYKWLKKYNLLFSRKICLSAVRLAAGQSAPVTTLDTENHPGVYGEYPKVYAGVVIVFGQIQSQRHSLKNICPT